jgi:hypothetical protein
MPHKHLFAFVAGAALALGAAGGALAQGGARDIYAGETLRGELARGDQIADDGAYVELFQFSGEAGRSYVVDLVADSFDAYLRVSGPGGLDNRDDDGGEDTNSRLTFIMPASGRVQISATSFEEGESGGYSISVQLGATPRVVRIGERIRGTLNPAAGAAFQSYRLDGAAGQRLAIDLESDDFDALLEVRALGSSEPIEVDDDGGEGLNSSMLISLPSAGAYEIRATSLSGDGEGDFTLALTEGPALREPTTSPINYGQILNGDLDESDGVDSEGQFYDVYLFNGAAGDAVQITLTSDDFDTELYLRAVGEEEWRIIDDDGFDGTDSRIEYTLPQGGEFEIHAVSYEPGETGRYTLGLSRR